jgi:hypothetical protein
MRFGLNETAFGAVFSAGVNRRGVLGHGARSVLKIKNELLLLYLIMFKEFDNWQRLI